MYEALRAYFLEGLPSKEAARRYGYTAGSFQVLCHQFRHDENPQFFVTPRHGPQQQPKKSAARDRAVELRKQNHSVYEISEILQQEGLTLSPTAVREILRVEGFAPLPRRLDEERPENVRPTVEPVADVRSFSLEPRSFMTRCGGLFLFLPDLVKLEVDGLAEKSGLPSSKMIPAAHALRSCLALKLWSIERKSHVMALTADEGLALFSGLNATPKKSYFSEYSSRVAPARTAQLLGAWDSHVRGEKLFEGQSFNLDFHSVPYYGEHPVVERHFVSMRSRRQPSILVFLAQDAEGHCFCYSNANLRKGEQADEIFRFIEFWKRKHGEVPRHLVFDSGLTTHDRLARLDEMGVVFITLRRRSAKLLQQIKDLPRSAWRTVELDNISRKYRTPRVYEQKVQLAGKEFRQLYIQDLGHDEPTILLTNDRRTTQAKLIARYAQRMLIENALSDAVRFFHMNALSSAVGLKVDFDMALLVIASGLYRLLARRMRGYSDAQARQIFRDLVDMPARVNITEREVHIQLERRAHLPIVLASGLVDKPINVPWWKGRSLRITG
ncbi:MAG: transposase [Gammaproteobacteria bacterium]